MTAVSGAVLTAAQWNTHVRDNLLESPAAKATVANQLIVSTGANAIEARTVGSVSGVGSGTTNVVSEAYADIVPSMTVTVTTGTRALVLLKAVIKVTGAGAIAYRVSGATTIAGDDTHSVVVDIFSSPTSLIWIPGASVHWITLTPGVNTFTLQFKTFPGGGNLNMNWIDLIVIPF